MKAVFGLFLVVLGVVASVEVPPSSLSPVYDYHRRFGIKRATELKRFEEQNPNGQRIVGGSLIDISETPYQVGLVMQVLWILTTICGGSLISSDRVITAAHCKTDGVLSAQAFTAVLGSNTMFSGGERINVAEADVIMHPGWNPSTAANDIAVMKLPSGVTFTDKIQPIALPFGDYLNEAFVGWNALASGYGLTISGVSGSSGTLNAVDLTVITNAQCAQVFGPFVHDSNVCISGVDGKSTCQGDSGGPLAVESADGNRVLIGVTSYGAQDGCDLDFPAAFARVTSFVSWVETI